MNLNRKGLIGTIIYHLILLLVLVFMGLTRPEPPPGEEGILVNFGTDDTGLGELEPSGGSEQIEEPDLPVSEAMEEQLEEAAPPLPARTEPEPVREDLTQDVEEVQVKEDPEPTPEELQRQREEQERIRREREEQERIRREQEEQERIERERREEQERIERQRQAQAERLNNMARNALGNTGEGEGQDSEGVTEEGGNQGDPRGTPGADRYDTGGGMGEGISFGLGDGRGSRNLEIPNVSGCEVTSRMEITVDIQVDRDGNVVKATVRGGTFQEKCIWDMVVEAAYKSRFVVDPGAPYNEVGWIRYIITP